MPSPSQTSGFNVPIYASVREQDGSHYYHRDCHNHQTAQEEQRLRMFENKIVRKIFEAKRDEVTGEWRKLHNAELHALDGWMGGPPAWLSRLRRLPAGLKLRSGAGSIPAWADYLVGFFPRFPRTVMRMQEELTGSRQIYAEAELLHLFRIPIILSVSFRGSRGLWQLCNVGTRGQDGIVRGVSVRSHKSIESYFGDNPYYEPLMQLSARQRQGESAARQEQYFRRRKCLTLSASLCRSLESYRNVSGYKDSTSANDFFGLIRRTGFFLFNRFLAETCF
ncbi:hypothetical protein ANN_07045 [Periplaneta americana]|uniref:Uncharacterized protein n=1 Tax=Periplaneta americana TaxID=6978 RepID=A0ABQ8TFV4_PERAM|nr:hypothetical protein ANN_07045 [Periplaneta americana]